MVAAHPETVVKLYWMLLMTPYKLILVLLEPHESNLEFLLKPLPSSLSVSLLCPHRIYNANTPSVPVIIITAHAKRLTRLSGAPPVKLAAGGIDAVDGGLNEAFETLPMPPTGLQSLNAISSIAISLF